LKKRRQEKNQRQSGEVIDYRYDVGDTSGYQCVTDDSKISNMSAFVP
jgi:hypothetical protein